MAIARGVGVASESRLISPVVITLRFGETSNLTSIFRPLIYQLTRYTMAPGAQMAASHNSLLERITIDSDVRFGKPCIRGHRITVQEILEWLSSGASQQQILTDYPQLETEDFLAVYAYAAELAAGCKVSRG